MSPYDLRMVTKAIAAAVEEGPRGTKARLARVLKVEPATVTKWVQGQAVPERHRWPAIEEALDLPAGSLARSASEPQSFELSDDKHEMFVAALRQSVVGAVDDLSWDSLMALLGAAAWLYHLERASVRHGVSEPGFDGLEDFLVEWARYGDVKELNDLARSRVERRLAQLDGRARGVLEVADLAQVTKLAAKSGETTAAGKITKAAKSTRKTARPKPPAED